MAKTLKDISNEVSKSIKDDLPVNLTSWKAKEDAKALKMKIYEAEKKTGAPVPSTFKEWDALD